jgi:phosphatidate cytidylyltransferase
VPEVGRSLRQAVATSLFLLVVVIVCYLLGQTAFFVLAAAVILFALFELLDATGSRGRANLIFGLAICLALLVAAFVRSPGWVIGIAAAVPAGALLLALRRGRGSSAIRDAAWTVLGVGWIGGGGAGAVSILALPRDGLRLLIGFMLVAAADDICAYFTGTTFGRHKLAPTISPSKTWEGLLGGVAGALVVAAVLIPLGTHLNLGQALCIGAIVVVLAPLGDLVESLVKRELGIKDSGTLLPGHGGMLDRVDAILFCAPAIYLYLVSTSPHLLRIAGV